MYKKIIALMFMATSSLILTNRMVGHASNDAAKANDVQANIQIGKENCPDPCDFDEDVLEDVDFGSDYDKSSYFSHLTTYSPRNCIGSCGFVSLIQALSYYDTFYNDNIIPEQYERNAGSKNTFEEAKLVSPGVLRSYYSGSTGAEYYNYCHSNMDKNLQSKLTVIQNQINGTDVATEDFYQTIGGWDYQELLETFYDEFNVDIDVTVEDTNYGMNNNAAYEQKIKQIIDSGHPAIVHICDYYSNGEVNRAHSVVAYGYDENGIYANFGYESNDNHQFLLGSPRNYTNIYRVLYLDFSANPEVCSDNYIVRGEDWCGCNLSNNMMVERGTNSSEEGPILYWRKDYTDENQWFRLDVFDGESPYPILYWQTTCNKLTIGLYNWDWIIRQSATSSRYLRFELQSFVDYSLKTTCIKYLLKANAVDLTEVSLGSHSYGFEQAYYSDVRIKNHVINNVSFTTERLRCGLIQGEKINLSARKKNEGSAYLEFYFDHSYIEHVALDISLWSDEEMINASNSTIFIKYVDNYGRTRTLCDLFNDITISTDRNNQNHLEFDLPIGVRSFGIYSTAEAVGTKNKGRVSIGDVVFQTYPETVANY